VSLCNIENRKRQARVIIIPAEERRLGRVLSDRRPASGAEMAIIIGWATSINPASLGVSPLDICKYKLSKNPIPDVAV